MVLITYRGNKKSQIYNLHIYIILYKVNASELHPDGPRLLTYFRRAHTNVASSNWDQLFQEVISDLEKK